MFDLCGVDIQTQAAYDLAVQGPLRPSSSNVPLIYSMRCIEFQKPHFTIGKMTQHCDMNLNDETYFNLFIIIFRNPRSK